MLPSFSQLQYKPHRLLLIFVKFKKINPPNIMNQTLPLSVCVCVSIYIYIYNIYIAVSTFVRFIFRKLLDDKRESLKLIFTIVVSRKKPINHQVEVMRVKLK